MKNNKIIDAYNEIKPDDYAMQRVWNKVTAERQDKKRILPIFAATAALLAIAFTTYLLFPTQANNSFTIRAHAIGQLEDGTLAMLELDISALNDAGSWGAFFDGEFLYLNIFFDISGDNISIAYFSTESGFFAKQYIDFGTTQRYVVDVNYNIIATTYVNIIGSTLDENNNVIPYLFNTEIVPLGNRIDLEDMEVESYLYFLAVPYRFGHCADTFSGDNAIKIQANVAFNDGEHQSETIILEFYDRGGGITHHSDLGDIGAEVVCCHINLEDAILIPESMQILPPYDDVDEMWGEQMYIWERDDGNIIVSRRFFREVGVERRYGISMIDGIAIMPVIRLDENGNFVGREYILPSEMARFFAEYRVNSPYYMP